MAFKFDKMLNGEKILRSNYRNEREYLGKIFDANKVKILQAFDMPYAPGKAREIFINNVLAHKTQENLSLGKALTRVARSATFTPQSEIFQENVVKALKNYGSYQRFREMTKDSKGHYTKFDPSKLAYNRKDNSYIYDHRVQIFFSNSPVGLHLQQL